MAMTHVRPAPPARSSDSARPSDSAGYAGHPRGSALHLVPATVAGPRHPDDAASPPAVSEPDLDPSAGVVYRHAVDLGELGCRELAAQSLGLAPTVVDAAVATLIAHRLLRADPVTQRLLPVDPEVATALLVTPMEREIHQREEQIARIRQRASGLREVYARSDRGPTGAEVVERIDGGVDLQGHLRLAAEACRSELRVLLGTLPDDGALDDLPGLCVRLAGRGVTVHVVGQHRSRADLRLRTTMRELHAAGVEVRTVTHVPRAAVVFDRRAAVLLGETEQAGGQACRVASTDVVGFLLDVFDHLWDGATPLASLDTGYAEIRGDLRQTIAGLMAKGFTDEVLARKLGMSLRTCRRHISSLMRELDSVSRFQAGVQAAQRQLITQA